MAENSQKLTDHRYLEPYWNFKIQGLGISSGFMCWGFVYYEKVEEGKYWASTRVYRLSLN